MTIFGAVPCPCVRGWLSSMTQRSRQVLADCESALSDLRQASQTELRRRRATAVALLKAVGHVLDKVDGETDSIATKVMRDASVAPGCFGRRFPRPSEVFERSSIPVKDPPHDPSLPLFHGFRNRRLLLQ